jgi:hypothetical protein
VSAALAPAGRVLRSALTPKDEATVAMIRLRDGIDQLGEFDRRELSKVLRELADIYAPRRPLPAA